MNLIRNNRIFSFMRFTLWNTHRCVWIQLHRFVTANGIKGYVCPKSRLFDLGVWSQKSLLSLTVHVLWMYLRHSIIAVTFAKRETQKQKIIKFPCFPENWQYHSSAHVFLILVKIFHHHCACDIARNMECIEIIVHSVTTKMSNVCICLESISYK